jgi:hypothetical protein
MARHDLLTTGIRRRQKGWKAYVRVNGHLYTKQFPRSATRAEMQAWRRRQREIATMEQFEQRLLKGPNAGRIC